MNNFQLKIKQIESQRLKLRDDLVLKMKTNPTMKDSETLRLVENDISFWEQQKDISIKGLINTLQQSLSLK